MKIAFIGQKGIPATFGGVEYHVDRLSRGLARQGHDVFVYVRNWYTEKNLNNYDGVHLLHLPALKTKHLDASLHSFLCSLHALFLSADIIHYHAIGPSSFSIIPRLFGKKVVATIHRLDWASGKWGSLARALLKIGEYMSVKLSHRTIVVSEDLKRYVQNKYNKEARLIPNGIDLPELQPIQLIGKKYHLSPRKYLLYLGRIVPEKRPDWLIKSFQSLLKTSSKAKDFKLIMAGGSSGTEEYALSLKELSQDSPNIIFTGYVFGQEKEELLSNASAFILPSILEGFPIALLEAKAYGLCCLASDIAPHQEAIQDGVDGLFFCHDDFNDFTAKLLFLIDHPKEAEEIGKAAREGTKKRMTWSGVVEKTLDVYKEVNRS